MKKKKRLTWQEKYAIVHPTLSAEERQAWDTLNDHDKELAAGLWYNRWHWEQGREEREKAAEAARRAEEASLRELDTFIKEVLPDLMQQIDQQTERAKKAADTTEAIAKEMRKKTQK